MRDFVDEVLSHKLLEEVKEGQKKEKPASVISDRFREKLLGHRVNPLSQEQDERLTDRDTDK
ncbi:MAG: hypothetical protein ACE5GZ_12220 [Gammaproteobacteria bacterium]